jgi:lyso-ornithine lipid O-acyltransferase
MNDNWTPPRIPVEPALTHAGALRFLLRGTALALVTFGSLALLLLLRLVERPLWGMRRPWTPHITQFVCRSAFVILGMKHTVRGRQMVHNGAMVANHVSWLDIFTLNAGKRIYFVAKSEVAAWPGIGLLARATGTLFIKRDRKEARAQKELLETRLRAGHKLLFFPEGTSTDGIRVLPFKSTLFAAFFSDTLRDDLYVQPVSVVYRSPQGEGRTYYGWWSEMDFAPNLLRMLAAPRHGSVEVVYHAPLKVSDYSDRKDMARDCELAVRSAMPDQDIALM